ncbi:response regulator transcription factor [Clostridium sp. B9]|uniref:response regulator transcription factor n=1 Tax=Clostridium sp. B9 TaxID=3423224 RepID=UPI003D2F449C
MLKILLVDDEATERDGIEFLIKKFDFQLEIYKATNGKEALDYIKRHSVDILFTDVKMPFMDGLELAKEVFNFDKTIKTVIFSAYSEFDYAKKALEAKVFNYLLKPIEIDEFKKVMGDVIESCNRNKLEEEKKIFLMKSNKKIVLYDLITKDNSEESIKERLSSYNINLNLENLLIINIESKNSFFQEYENVFLTLVSAYMKYDYEYVNFYPNESYLILHSNSRINELEVEEFCNKLLKEIRMLKNEECIFFVGNILNMVSDIFLEARRIEEIKSKIYEFTPKVFMINNFNISNEVFENEIESIRENINKSILSKDLNKTGFYIDELIDYLLKKGAASTIYIHHIFYDLVDKLFVTFNIYDKQKKKSMIQKVLGCNSNSNIKLCFHEIIEEVGEFSNNEIIDEKGVANKVIRIIQAEYDKELSLDYISEKVNFTSSYLSYVFKKETGSNIVKYITDFRMDKAKEFLEIGNMKIVQVAKACGYENQSYFNRIFKNTFGVTPKVFKESACK